MKWLKFFLWLIIIGLVATLVLQNLDYFKMATALNLDLKVLETWKWQIPELQTGYYFLICFFIGLLITGLKAIAIKLRMNRTVKSQTVQISGLKDQINTLKTELEVFKNDPYIKKALVAEEIPADPVPAQEPDKIADEEIENNPAEKEEA